MSVHLSTRAGLLKRVSLVIVAGSLALSVAACGKKSDGGGSATDDGNGGIGGRATASADTASPSNGAGGGGNSTADPNNGNNNGNGNGSNNNNNGNNSGGNTTKSSAPPAASIVYFRLKSNPSCPSGTNKNYIEGKDAVVEWKISGADKAELAVDGPGLYDSYSGTTGSQTLGFGCGDWQPGQTAKHTYTLSITDKNGQKHSKTITATAKVNEITQV
jgi:hypothetical protein